MGKPSVTFCVNVVAHFCRLPPQCTSPKRRLPKKLKQHCNSTSGTSEIGAKHVQHKRREILGKHCVAFCVNVVAHLFYVATSVYISREAASVETKTALQYHFRYVRNLRQTCATDTKCNPLGKHCIAFCVNVVAHFSRLPPQCTSPGGFQRN